MPAASILPQIKRSLALFLVLSLALLGLLLVERSIGNDGPVTLTPTVKSAVVQAPPGGPELSKPCKDGSGGNCAVSKG